jgi:glycosyltransferase involved in cell wall biosynthesis
MLDILPELTSRFDLVVIDDCSTDSTIEVADELAAYYVAVQPLAHAKESS